MSGKICSKCETKKSFVEFHKCAAHKDGLRSECKICKRNAAKKYYTNNIDDCRGRSTNYRSGNRERALATTRTWRKKNKDYKKNKRQNDIMFRLKENIRSRVRHAISGKSKPGSTIKCLGCSAQSLKKYLEGKFYTHNQTNKEMSWDNYGIYGWHIDHIIPLSSFDLTDRDQFVKACNYTNLQPLWAKENLSKGARLDWIKK